MEQTEKMDVCSDATPDAGKQFSRIGIAFVIGSAVIYGAQFLLSLLLKDWRSEWLADTNISLLLSAVTMYGIGMPIMYLLIKKVPAVAIPRHSMSVGKFLLALLMCYPIMYCSNLIGIVITSMIGLLKGSAVTNQVLNVVTDADMVVIFAYMVICAPIMEELIFRKLIVDRTARYGQKVAVVVSGIMFGLFHGNLNQFIYATLLGMFLAFMYVKTGNIKISIGIHMVINFMGGIISTLLLKAIHYEELMELTYNGAGVEELMQFYITYLPGWILYTLYILFIFAVVITGIVLLVVFRKRFVLDQGEVVLPKEKRFRTIFVNPGMLLFALFWIVMIIVQLFVG